MNTSCILHKYYAVNILHTRNITAVFNRKSSSFITKSTACEKEAANVPNRSPCWDIMKKIAFLCMHDWFKYQLLCLFNSYSYNLFMYIHFQKLIITPYFRSLLLLLLIKIAKCYIRKIKYLNVVTNLTRQYKFTLIN